MPLHKHDVPPDSRLVKPTWDEIGGSQGVALDLGVYQFYPTYAFILAPLRAAFAGVLFRLFTPETNPEGNTEAPALQLLPRAIWPHTIMTDQLIECTLKAPFTEGTPWRAFLGQVDTITLPMVYPWLRHEQTIAAAMKGQDIEDEQTLRERLVEKGDTNDGPMAKT
jgi:hypothetical protein